MSSSRFFSAPTRLETKRVLLEPLSLLHAEELFRIGAEPAIWEWMPRAPLVSLKDTEDMISEALAARETGSEYPMAVIDKRSGNVAGSTRYLEIVDADRRIEIGWTWYGLEYQRTAINTECKLLLLEFAFEKLGAVRVQLKTDARNLRSQNAIKRIGALYEGTLRKHRVLAKDGFIRDTVYFSVIDDEWPKVKEDLFSMLQSYG